MTRFDPDKSALLLVDIQPDFMPGGPLACAGGDTIIGPVAALLAANRFRHCVATQDWHPPGHISFASMHTGREPLETIQLYGREQTLWPEHCVQDSKGAQLHPDIPWRNLDVIIRKGTDPEVDSYSGFRNNWDPRGERPPTGLAGFLHHRGVSDVFLCGLARDVCVKWTAEDAVAAGFNTWLLWDLTRPVTHDTDENTRRSLEESGVTVIDSDQLADLQAR